MREGVRSARSFNKKIDLNQIGSMQIKILSPLWGYEQEDLSVTLDKISLAGYDGIDTHIPDDELQRNTLLEYVQKKSWTLVVQQHQAEGETFEKYKQSYLHYLQVSAACNPLLINCHTGKDYFTNEQNLELIKLAIEFSRENDIEVVHETHRGRFGYHPSVMLQYFDLEPELTITADLSHWTCVTESFLGNFTEPLEEAIARTRHIHARVGYEEGPQIPDPRAPEWKHATDIFLNWWGKMVEKQLQEGREILTITTEFGPIPYLQKIPYSNKPVADQFEVNCYMKDLLKERYAVYSK